MTVKDEILNEGVVMARVLHTVQKIISKNTDGYGMICHTPHYSFYIKRLYAVPNYGLVQGKAMLAMICRCAFNDERLTDAESINIIKVCHDERWHNILMEVNYNEGWN